MPPPTKEKQMSNKLKTTNQSHSKIKNSEKGFSLLELLVAMIIFLIVTAAAYGVLLVGKRSRTTVNEQVQLTKNVRVALNLIGRDTYNAGYNFPLKSSVNLPDNRVTTLVGVPNDADSATDIVTPIIAGNDINPNTFAVPNTNTDQITFLFKDSTFNLTGDAGPPDKRVSQPFVVSNLALNSSVAEATINPSSGTNAACEVNDLFIVTGSNGSALGVVTKKSGSDKIQFGAGDVLNFNQNGSFSPIAVLSPSFTMQRITLVSYFVADDGTLTRRDYANNTSVSAAQPYVDNPLVYGVEDFQIQYVLADGTLSDNPGAGADGKAGNNDDNPINLNSVRQIRYTISVKSTETNETGQPYRMTMTASYGTRNLGYDVN